MHPIKLFLLTLSLSRLGDGHVYWEDRVREMRLDECLRPLLPEVLLSKEAPLPQSINCSRDLAVYRLAIARRDHWALKMLDSSSKMPTGLMQGNLIDPGMFDQCLDVAENEIRGHHCMYSMYPAVHENALPLHPRLSICLPASCSKNDIEWIVNETISASDKLMELEVKIGNISCTNAEPRTITTRLIIFLLLLGSYVAFLGFCTYCDILESRGGTKLIKPHLLHILADFSMLKSAKAIFTLKTHKDSLPVIDGLRALSNMGTIFVHVYLFQILDLNSNIFYLQKLVTKLTAKSIVVCAFCVDTFFVLTGFLAAYGYFKKIQQGKQTSVLRYYIHRYFRLTLPMLMTVFLTVELAPIIIEIGPRHDFITDTFIKGCPSKLWSYFIYMHNYVKREDLCSVHLWSLAVDMQLYWISPLIFYPLYKKPKIGLALLISLFLSSVIAIATLVWINKYSTIYFDQQLNASRVLKTISDIHITTLTRASSWLLGALFGYEAIQKNIKPNKLLLIVGWVLAAAGFVFVTWGASIFTDIHYEYNIMLEAIFSGLLKPAWAFSICWVIYASLHDFGGLPIKILSSKLFLPLSKLAYSVYLIHPILPIIKLATRRTQNYFHQQLILFSFFEIITTSLVLGFCFSILFEMPMFALEKLMFKDQPKITIEHEKGQ